MYILIQMGNSVAKQIAESIKETLKAFHQPLKHLQEDDIIAIPKFLNYGIKPDKVWINVLYNH